MADKKEVNILLLGAVAILAIVGLVLLFSSPAATGKAYQMPPMGPQTSYPAPSMQYAEVPGSAFIESSRNCAATPVCPDGRHRVEMQKNVYMDGKFHSVCACPGHPGTPAVYVSY